MALVLALEPDLRQAAIIKRVIRQQVKADLVLVDSRDAAMAALAAGVPDVVLLTALLSPRDEEELITHLRSLAGAEHLQTHTIPQLASRGPEPEGRADGAGQGLLKRFRKKKASEQIPGCDPELFAVEVRAFLERAAELKAEAAASPAARVEGGALANAAAAPTVDAPAAPDPSSAWSSPFEWRRTDPPQAEAGPSAEAVPRPKRGRLVQALPLAVIAEEDERRAAELSAETERLRIVAAEAEAEAERARAQAAADKARADRERQRLEAEAAQERERVRLEAEEAIRRERERLRLAADAAAKAESERLRAKAAAEAKAQAEAAAKARAEAEEALRVERERLRLKAEAAAQAERERLRLKAEAEARAQAEAAARARAEAEEALRVERERLRLEAEAAAQAERERLRLAEEAAQAERERLRVEAEASADAERERLRMKVEAAASAESERLRLEAEADVGEDAFAEFREDADVERGVFRLMPLALWARREVPQSQAPEPASEGDLHDLLAHFALPPHVAGVAYPRGCRIRRVRVPAAPGPGRQRAAHPVIVSRRALEEMRAGR